jgi:PAS domain S-box-containing protein
MTWLAAALAYCVAYLAAVSLVGDDPMARRWAGNLGLLLSPILPVAIVVARHRAWNGRALIYWSTVAIGCGLWVAGHLGWSAYELQWNRPLPWLEWPVALKLTGGVMPMLGLICWPHARIRGGSLATAVLDIAGLTLVSGFLFWSLIVAPGFAPNAEQAGIWSLAVIGSVLHFTIVGSFLLAARAAGDGPWRTVYHRLAIGAAAGSVLLTTNASAMASGTYATGAFGDIGWIVPFWCLAWAASEAPASPRPEVSPLGNWIDPRPMSPLLFVPALVPIVGYGPRLIAPLGPSVDRLCDVVTAATLTVALGLTLVRVAVEQRARHRSDYRVWLLATACEQIDDLIVVTRADAIEYANTAFQRAFGYPLQDLRVLPPQALVAQESLGAIPSLAATLRRHESARTRLTLRRKDGSTFEAACSVTPISSASGRTSYFVGIVHDLTEEVRLRNQLVKQERLSAIGEAMSGATHEISEPLQSLIGLVELLQQNPLDAEARRHLDHMHAEVNRAGRIVRALQWFVRRAPYDRHPIDLNETARRAVDLRRQALTTLGIRVEETYTPRMPAVFATGDDLQQVVWQLVMNAEEAMTRGGGSQITLRTSVAPDQRTVVLEVADDGPGIPLEAADRIFEPFYSTKPAGGGQGLGLSIAFGIVVAHGGTLEFVTVAHGSCFRITLPAIDV